MEERISTIKKLDLKKDDMYSIVMFDKALSGGDLKFLEDEFDFYNEDANKFASNYKNIGVVFKLTPINREMLKDWRPFIQKVIKKKYDFDRFNNIFVNNGYDKVLLVTNKRLLKVDLERLNEKIEEINYRIEKYDEKIEVEMRNLAESAKEEHKGFFSKIIEVLKK